MMEPKEELQTLLEAYNRAPNSYAATAKLGLFLCSYSHMAEQGMEFLLKADALAGSREERGVVLHRLGQVAAMFKPHAAVCAIHKELSQLFPERMEIVHTYANDLLWNGQPKEAARVAGKAMAQSLGHATAAAEAQGTRPRQLFNAPELLAAFGEISDTLGAYVMGRRLGLLPDVEAIVLIGGAKLANRFLIDCWRRAAPEITWVEDEAECRRLPDLYSRQVLSTYWFSIGREILYRHDALVRYQRLWDQQGRPPLLTLPDEVVERGETWLRELGLPADAWFAALHIRDGGDRSVVADGLNRGRNGEIETALPAIRRIVKAGGWVVRLGNKSDAPLADEPGVVDLTDGRPREDWQDIFLLARCRFMMCSYSGPFSVAQIFHVPTVCFNVFPHKYIVGSRSRDIVIHKLYRHLADGLLLSFDEMVSPEVVRLFHPMEIRQNGLELVNNSADDIDAVIAQMLNRLGLGEAAADDPEHALNDAYDALRQRRWLETGATIGGQFLRRHADLI